MKKTLLVMTAALAVAFAGCGDEDSDPASGPASVIPDMPLYIEGTVKPDGEQAEDLDAFLAELGEIPLLGSVADPGDLAIAQLESQAEAAGVDFSYAEDVEPWLGEKAGFGIAEDGEGETRFVAALETTDEEQARDSIASFLSEDSVPYEEEEYEGVSYFAAPDDSYRLGVFADHVVLASAADFEDAVDASEGDSLASNDKLTESFAQLGDEGLASVFIDLEQFAALDSSNSADFEQAEAIVPEYFENGFAASVGVSDNQIYLDYVTPLVEGQPEAGASPLLGTAPGDALGAFAIESVGEFGPPIADLLTRAEEAGAELEDFPEEGLEASFEDHVGVSIDEAAAALGDASLWVRGELPDGLEVAGEIEVSDTDAATGLIEAVEEEFSEEQGAKVGPPVGGSDVGFSLLEQSDPGLAAEKPSDIDLEIGVTPDPGHSDLPFVNVELDGDVIRYGFFKDEDAAAASDPDSGGDFSETDTYAAGEEGLGDDFEYVGAFDLGPVLDEAVGSALDSAMSGASPEDLVAGAIAEKFGVVAFGVRYEDDAAIQRYTLGLAE